MLFDVHCHLSFPEFDQDRDEVVKRAAVQDISIINSSVSIKEVEKARAVKSRYPKTYWTLGLSASETSRETADETIAAIKKYRSEISGIGEVGLDYYWVKDEQERAIERENFRRFIKLSKELGLPLVVHSRDAEEDCVKMLVEEGKPALMHCFSGTVEQAVRAASFGCLISIPANVTHSKSRQKLAVSLPLESLALETDAPYLAPVPKTRNEPVNIKVSVEKIAEIKNVTIDEVARKTTHNAMKFFNIKR
jgi:TatD DNase family protein